MSLIDRAGSSIEQFTDQYNPWTNIYGIARSCLAFGTLLTLVFNDTGILFRPIFGVKDVPSCVGVTKLSLFCMFSENLEAGRFFAIIVLLIVLTGFYPRYTAILHWWVSFSFISSATIVDGGDQIASVLTLLLIPIAITDNRRNHWQSALGNKSIIIRLVAISSVCVIRLQVAILYFHSAVSKFNVAEWVDGTAIYYWFLDPMFGISYHNRTLLTTILSNAGVVTLFTWGSLILELLLASALVLPGKHLLRQILLPAGIVFHFSILIVHGLASFFFSMAGALILYLVPMHRQKDVVDVTLSHENSKHSKHPVE